MEHDRADSLPALQRMRITIARIKVHIQGRSMEQFLADKVLCDAVLMQLSALGEEVRRVDPDLLNKYDYPWHKVRAQRNVIVHDYFGIRLPSIWANVQQDLGPLDELLERIIQNEFS
ncbi:MAG TPA: DUF86 domain-containing protein [Flavobacteriales bacterium]|nr:DUF86 domain-containing protein [Flavobacteriales bacterium]HRO40417.1 DUF86 domain-containing protein [Flavobacteriales bacterium]HRP82274.1 DUF86 domain-containing protein [Flavobacteriales bacterium]